MKKIEIIIRNLEITLRENRKQLHHCISVIKNRTSIPLNTTSKHDPHNECEPPRDEPLKRITAALKPNQTGNRTLNLGEIMATRDNGVTRK